MSKRLTTYEFIERAKNKHGNKYNYSNVSYVNNQTNVTIICQEHGEFERRPDVHLRGEGCYQCNKDNKMLMVFNKLKIIHDNKYEYHSTDYNGVNKKISIICPKHGVFKQRGTDHLNGHGCPKCAGVLINSTIFINNAKKIHTKNYNYSLINYVNAHTKITIICQEHGKFLQTPNSHLSGRGCPTCHESHGEREIRNLLKENNIKFIHQYKFKDCKNIKPLPFDFYLPEYNICIEYNGRQHYEMVKVFGGIKSFEKIQINDEIKNKYCIDNNINLISIKYTDNIKSVISYINKYEN